MRKKIITVFGIIAILAGFLYCENNWITTTKMVVYFDRLPKEFDGLRIVQISDLHNKEFGKNQRVLLKKIKELNPDNILITGDIIDAKKYNLDVALELIEQIKKICPVYFVNGNHEWKSGRIDEIDSKIGNEIRILENEKVILKRNNSEICIIGIDVLGIQNMYKLKEDRFSIVLSHKPEYFDEYVNNKFDIVFAGHTHGGQFRIPFLGGVFAPNQGFFPKYISGIYEKDNTKMFVSRGLGNSVISQRIFNRPELVLVEIRKKYKYYKNIF